MAAKKYLGASWGGGVKRDFYPIIQKVGVIVISLVLVVYFLSMVVIPWSQGRSWGYVQDVWSQWQTFNAAMIALCASFVGLYAARRHAKKQEELAEDQRRREFVAARAFLTESLAELNFYFQRVESQYRLVYSGFDEDDPLKRESIFLRFGLPEIPESYREVFRSSIRYAEPEYAEYLTEILNRLQIIGSRIRGLSADIQSPSPICKQENVVSELLDVIHVQALCNRLFDFGRVKNLSVDLSIDPSAEEMRQVISNWYFPLIGEDSSAMKLKSELVDGSEVYTKIPDE